MLCIGCCSSLFRISPAWPVSTMFPFWPVVWISWIVFSWEISTLSRQMKPWKCMRSGWNRNSTGNLRRLYAVRDCPGYGLGNSHGKFDHLVWPSTRASYVVEIRTRRNRYGVSRGGNDVTWGSHRKCEDVCSGRRRRVLCGKRSDCS